MYDDDDDDPPTIMMIATMLVRRKGNGLMMCMISVYDDGVDDGDVYADCCDDEWDYDDYVFVFVVWLLSLFVFSVFIQVQSSGTQLDP